jgi:hypothetical protein
VISSSPELKAAEHDDVVVSIANILAILMKSFTNDICKSRYK